MKNNHTNLGTRIMCIKFFYTMLCTCKTMVFKVIVTHLVEILRFTHERLLKSLYNEKLPLMSKSCACDLCISKGALELYIPMAYVQHTSTRANN